MNPDAFVQAIRSEVEEGALKATVGALEAPPGRKPDPGLVEESQWFKQLTEAERELVKRVLVRGVQQALFSLFCVLDGVRAIESGEGKGELKLHYIRGNDEILLNDATGEPLHDIYNWHCNQH